MGAIFKAGNTMRIVMADLEKNHPSKTITETIARLEKSGYKAGL